MRIMRFFESRFGLNKNNVCLCYLHPACPSSNLNFLSSSDVEEKNIARPVLFVAPRFTRGKGRGERPTLEN